MPNCRDPMVYFLTNRTKNVGAVYLFNKNIIASGFWPMKKLIFEIGQIMSGVYIICLPKIHVLCAFWKNRFSRLDASASYEHTDHF